MGDRPFLSRSVREGRDFFEGAGYLSAIAGNLVILRLRHRVLTLPEKRLTGPESRGELEAEDAVQGQDSAGLGLIQRVLQVTSKRNRWFQAIRFNFYVEAERYLSGIESDFVPSGESEW